MQDGIIYVNDRSEVKLIFIQFQLFPVSKSYK